MAYNTPETVADYLARFQMEITHRGKGTFTPDHVKYSLTIASGGKDFFTTFESNPHVHGEPTITQVFGALASDAMVVRDYGMDEFVDEFCDGMKPSAAIRAYNSCKETYDWMRDGLYLSNGDIASLSEVISENEDEVNTLVEKAASERAARYAYDHPKLPKGFVTIEQLQGDLDLGDLRDEVEDFDFDGDITEAFGETAEYKVDDNATFEEKYGEDFADCADNFIQDKVYTAICERYAMQFLPPAVYDVSESAVSVDGGTLKLTAKRLSDAGFTAVFPNVSNSRGREDSDTGNPWVPAGSHTLAGISCSITEGETTPPAPYTEGTLITDMASIAKYVKDPEIREKELEKKIRERNRKWRSLVTHSAGESVLSAVGCAWQELDLDALDRFLASHADEVSDMLTAHGSTPEDAKARLDARKKKTVKTEPVADGGLQAAEPDSENSDW